jgi:hypothetical protein
MVTFGDQNVTGAEDALIPQLLQHVHEKYSGDLVLSAIRIILGAVAAFDAINRQDGQHVGIVRLY